MISDHAARPRDLRLCALAVAIVLPLVVAQLVALDVPSLRRLELIAFDAQIRARGPRAPGPETVIVMIDDATIAALGRWPVPREKLAELVTLLDRAGARTIGIDVLFAEREAAVADAATPTAGDEALARAMRSAGSVVLPYAFRFGGASEPRIGIAAPRPYATLRQGANYRPLALQPTAVLMPMTALVQAADLGHIVVAYDVDGTARYDYPALEFDVDYYPSMAVRIAQRYLNVRWDDVGLDLGSGVSIGPVRIPTDASLRMLIDYLGPSPAFPTYGLSDVLNGSVPTSAFRDRIVLVGSNALGTRDTFKTPFTAVMPGVERLATTVDAIVHQRHLHRPQAAPITESAFMVAAALTLGIVVSRLSLALASVIAVGFVLAFAVSAQVALARFGVWQASAIPMVAIVATFIGLSLYRYGLLDKERRHIRRVFQRYLSPAMVERVVASDQLPQLGGELRELTILFCDLRGFTALSERLDPAALTRVVNGFLQAATDAILAHGGTVDKYVGDAVMAFWNAPLEQPEHATLACRAALEIRRRIEALNRAPEHRNLPRLEAGIGINTGRCTVGNFGSTHRFDYSAIGDAVNIAARLESETRGHDMAILIGPETAAKVTGLATVSIGTLKLRGRAEPLAIYALVADA
jgi:adenylate cyclase